MYCSLYVYTSVDKSSSLRQQADMVDDERTQQERCKSIPFFAPMRATECGFSTLPSIPFQKLFNPRRRIGFLNAVKANLSETNVKRAKLSANKQKRVQLPNYHDVVGSKESYHISNFLIHPSGIQAILNTNALQNVQLIDSNLYRCTLPQIRLLNFEVAPVLDLRVTPTEKDCVVEMLSCKFQGSEIVERQNDHFSAFMRNRITWDTNESGAFLNVDVNLNLTLEIYTRPFTMLPTSVVEIPGNVMIQALVDNLMPLLLQQLLRDYDKWVQQQRGNLSFGAEEKGRTRSCIISWCGGKGKEDVIRVEL